MEMTNAIAKTTNGGMTDVSGWKPTGGNNEKITVHCICADGTSDHCLC